jgi:hypothetical protein
MNVLFSFVYPSAGQNLCCKVPPPFARARVNVSCFVRRRGCRARIGFAKCHTPLRSTGGGDELVGWSPRLLRSLRLFIRRRMYLAFVFGTAGLFRLRPSHVRTLLGGLRPFSQRRSQLAFGFRTTRLSRLTLLRVRTFFRRPSAL